MSTPILNCIRIDRNQAKKVSPVTYGWHYEEIGMIGDGGLYAEMIFNRNFSETGTAPGKAIHDGVYSPLPRARVPERWPERLPQLNGWRALGGGEVSMRRIVLNEASRSYAMEIITSKELPIDTLCGVANDGFFGMHTEQGAEYCLTLYLSAASGSVQVGVADESGYVTTPVVVPLAADKTRHKVTLCAGRATNQGFLLITPLQTGCLTVHFASLFPRDTWDEGRSVFRKDILQNMLDFKPEFLRFPGGCIVHGVNVETMYHWKETLADLPDRKSSWSKWKPHWITNGIGYHEFYQLCEYLGADAMYVTPSGLICTDWAEQLGSSTDFCHPEVDVNEYIQDCLDAIEYAIGPADSTWGAKRAAKGHPAPFPLRYLSIGNEDFGPRYYKNYHAFYQAIKQRYPQLRIIATSIIGNRTNSVWNDKRERLAEFIDPTTVEIFDEHYYDSGDWVFENFDRFDAYDRNGPDLMCLELGLTSNQVSDVLYESIFLMMMEKNGELDPVFAGRPLMRNWTYVSGELNPFYYHTNDKSWKTIHYYAKKLFRDHRFDQLLPASCCRMDGKQEFGEETLFSTAGIDTETGELILKVVNLAHHAIAAPIEAGLSQAAAWVATLVNTPVLPQTPEASACAGPEVFEGTLNFTAPYVFPAQSLTVMRVRL